jgi:hypothetical protein
MSRGLLAALEAVQIGSTFGIYENVVMQMTQIKDEGRDGEMWRREGREMEEVGE